MCAQLFGGSLKAFSAESAGEMNTFEATNHYFQQAARIMELPERVQTLLINPHREVKVAVSIQLDNGELAIFDAYRIQQNDSRGPMKGGLRYHPDVNLEEAEGEVLA